MQAHTEASSRRTAACSLYFGGRYLLVGFSGGLGGIARALVAGGFVHLCGRARFVTGAADPTRADLVFLQELIDAGKLRTVIGRRYTLDEIADAHRYADTGHKIGNVAVLIVFGSVDRSPKGRPMSANRCGSSAARARDVGGFRSHPADANWRHWIIPKSPSRAASPRRRTGCHVLG